MLSEHKSLPVAKTGDAQLYFVLLSERTYYNISKKKQLSTHFVLLSDSLNSAVIILDVNHTSKSNIS